MLDELVKTIKTLKARISEHRTALQASEAQTRLSLIDPLLRALGWDTADPALVRPEFTLSGGRADYALLGEAEKPVAIMEAKRLNEALGTMDRRMQMLTYANFSNVAYAGLTDGDQWVLYRVFDQKPLEDRLVLDLSIVNLPAHESALKLLLLWHPNLSSGQPIEASEPIVGTEGPDSAATSLHESTGYSIGSVPRTEPTRLANAAPVQTPEQSVPGARIPNWIPLTHLVAEKGSKYPPMVRFPEEPEQDIRGWKYLLIEVAEWLVRMNALTREHGIVTANRRLGHCTVNLEPRHLNGIDFKNPKRLSNGLYLDVNFSASDCVKHSRAVIEHCRRDPAQVHVQVG